MKLRYTFFVVLGILVSSSLFNAGITTAQGSPNTNFKTGDNFYFNTTETRNDAWTSLTELANPTDPSELYRYQEDITNQNENVEGDLDLFLIKPDANLPAFTGPDGDYDHIIIVEWSGMTVAPSSRSHNAYFFDGGDPNCNTWCNSTVMTEDTTGRYHSNDQNNDEPNWQPLVSNATYIVQMSEMTENSVGFREAEWIQESQYPLGNFDHQLDLTSRNTIFVPGRTYFVNGASRTFDTNKVTSTFATTHSESFATQIYMGDQNGQQDDPSAWVNVNATIDISATYTYEYHFDANTGMIVEIGEISSYSMALDYFNSSMKNPREGPTDMSVHFSLNFGGSRSSLQTINEASSFYGNTREVSSDTNRLQEGDKLTYHVENEQDFSFDMYMVGSNSSLEFYDKYDSKWGSYWADGIADFDVYRHRNGGFDAVMFIKSTAEGDSGWENSGTEFTTPYSYSNTSTWGPQDDMEYDYQTFLSSDTEEIVHFFDDKRHFDDDFLYDDEGDDFRLNYNRELSKSGAVNDSTFHMDFEGDEIVVINDFDHTWFDVQMYGQYYEKTYNQAVQIPISRDENGESWVTVQLTGVASAYQNFFYDKATGVLLAVEESTDVQLFLNGNGLVNHTVNTPEGPNQYEINVDVDLDITLHERFFLLLEEHPIEYLTAESADPVVHTTTSTSSTSSSGTSTTTTDPTSTSDTSEDGGADLPLPVPIVPVLSALGIVVIYVRKRKF